MYSRFVIFIYLIVGVLLVSCNTDSSDQYTADNQGKSKSQKESLITANRYLVNTEDKEISNYIRRHNLDVVETGSGLKYQITRHGDGEKAHMGRIAFLDYKVKLITGDVIYSSDEYGPKIFEIGHGGVETGLEEAILNMRVGDEAIIIIPSHLAFGLLGDDNKIPPRSTIIYEIEFTNIN